MSSPGRGSSPVQDPSNIRKYCIYPTPWQGSQDRKTRGPGVKLEGCETTAVLLLTQPPPPSSVCSPAAPRGWCQPGSCPTVCGQCALSMAAVSEPTSAAGSSHRLWDLDLLLYPSTAHIHLQESSRNVSALAPVTDRLSEKRFFPPACYKTILNGDCNLSTLNKWGSCILKLISHHQPLPNNNNCTADGPVSCC